METMSLISIILWSYGLLAVGFFFGFITASAFVNNEKEVEQLEED